MHHADITVKSGFSDLGGSLRFYAGRLFMGQVQSLPNTC